MSLASPFAAAPVPTPEQLSIDARSRTAFARLGQQAAVALANKDFHIAVPTWTTPGSEQGSHVLKYLGNSAIAEKLPNGQHVVISSTVPVRTDNASGQPTPVSLTLREDNEGYVPQNPLVPVVISKQPRGGIALPQGIRVTPVTQLAAEAPTIIGNSVMVTNVSPDTDLIEQPLPTGGALSWQLRSQESAPDDTLNFHLRKGETLHASTSIPGGAEVTEGDKPLLLVSPANAVDASGKSLLTAYSISGDELTTHVDLSGPVDYPVLVDPSLTFAGYYGTENVSGSWADWRSELSPGYELFDEANFLGASSPHGEPFNAYGLVYIFAPGEYGEPGSAGITRVDLTDMVHDNTESTLYATIAGSNGSPIYTFDGEKEGDEESAPLYTDAKYYDQAVAFCAEWAGGYDGDPTGEPLCDEKYNQGTYFILEDVIDVTTSASYNDAGIGGARITYRDAYPPNRVTLNDNGYTGEWLKSPPSGWTISAEDEGLGVQEFALEAPAGNGHYFSEASSCDDANGFTGCPSSATSAAINLVGVAETGRWELQPIAVDAAGNVNSKAENRVNLYIDRTPPVIGELGGTLGRAANHLIGNGNYTLNYSAEDGAPAHPQSGVKSIEVKLDGKLVATTNASCPKPEGVPSEGCYSLSGTWTMNGQTYGVGVHTITVVARDWVGNQAEKSFNVTVNEAAYEPVGPGAVNLESGDFKLSATDVSLSGGAATLSVSRTYDSREPTQGTSGPLGPQWTLVLPDSAAGSEWQSLEPLANGSVAVYGEHGNQIVYALNGSTYISPLGYQNDTLAKSGAEYIITNADGDYTTFKQIEATGAFVPTSAAQATAAGGLNKVHYSFTRSAEGIVEPIEMLAPEPSEGACNAQLVQGCRALTFAYATSTNAEGEGEKEWGEYKGRLSKVYFTAWEPVKGEMSQPIAVAQYSYDSQGRLRAEWDPRVPKPLTTRYGYDSEGHVTAVSAPGQQPWLLHYGTIPNEPDTGRLLSVTRLGAGSKLWNGKTLVNKKPPLLTKAAAVVGTTLGIKKAVWSQKPVVLTYQWERCNYAGVDCAPIDGAVNATYVLVVADDGQDVRAKVTATDASGSASATTKLIGPVTDAPAMTANFGSEGHGAGQLAVPEGLVLTPSGDLWVADTYNERIDEFSEAGAFIEAVGWGVANGEAKVETCTTAAGCKKGREPEEEEETVEGQMKGPDGIAVSQSDGDMYVSEADSWIEEFSASGAFIRRFGGPAQLIGATAVAVDSRGNVWVGDRLQCRVIEYSATGILEASYGECGTKLGQFDKEGGKLALLDGSLYVTDGAKIQVLSEGKWQHELSLPLNEHGEESVAEGIAGNELTGELDVTVAGKSWEPIDVLTPAGTLVEAVQEDGEGGVAESRSLGGLAVSPVTGAMYAEEPRNGRIGIWTLAGPSLEPPPPASDSAEGSVTTVDYQVPLSGSGLPQMTPGEVAKWAQVDDPAEGTAIFPASEPQGWPASEYKHAEIFYLDSANRTVNVVSPSGAISTAEYNGANNNVEHSLSPDDRLVALKESNSAVAAELLQSESVFNPEGTELTSTLGPRHTVRLANGTEVSARKHTQYFYDEGAPGGGTYHLVTKTIEGAEITGQEEKEQRIVRHFYNGQGNLGWTLHASTSTETSTGGETLTSTSSYEPSTGEVKETQTPVGSHGSQQTGNAGAHTTQVIYYTDAPNASYPNCGKHPEWAALPCEEKPAAQPESGLPKLPESTYTYNIWDEPVTTTDIFGSEKATRTATLTYDGAGRLVTSAIASNVDRAVPTVTDEYSPESGLLVKQSTNEGKADSIVSEYNRLGQLTKYTDAAGNVTQYEYEDEKENRLTKVIDGEDGPAASSQTYGYSSATGQLTSVKDSGAGTFTAAYDVEGNITTEGYPNGMNANYTYNEAGERIGLEYVKTTHCTTGCVWYTDSVKPSIHDQWLSQASTMGGESYTYDGLGRLTEAQETPAGKDCTARQYAYDEDGNRTSLTTREARSETCTSEGSTTQNFAYDTADRLEEGGVTYDQFGNVTGLPAADAGGSALTGSYYADNALATQEQNGEKVSYSRDPVGRVNEASWSGTMSVTITEHYEGPSDTPAWESASNGSWTRNIDAFSGLVATQEKDGPAVLELGDLHGDIIGTANDSETESKFTATSESSEYGVPHASVAGSHGWLGSDGVSTELPSGVINMGARTYVPQLGRFLQMDPVPGGSVNSYAYTDDDPVNTADPTGEFTTTTEYNFQDAAQGSAAQGLPEVYARPGSVEPPEVNLQIEAAANANPPWDAPYTFAITLGGGGYGADAAKFSLSKAFAKVKSIVSETIEEGVQQVKSKATHLWDAVTSVIFEQAYACIDGADELAGALDAEEWREYPVFEATISLVGCAGTLQGADYGGSAKTGHF